MIRCTKCGYVGNYYGRKCPSCKESFYLTPDEMDEKIAEIEKAEELKEYELVAEGHHILADMGRAESQKKYAALLEKGYNPINQIVGYLLSEDPTYITNHRNARSLIRKLDRDELLGCMLKQYLED